MENVYHYPCPKERTVASPEKPSSPPHLHKALVNAIVDVFALNAVQVGTEGSRVLNQVWGLHTKKGVFMTLGHSD